MLCNHTEPGSCHRHDVIRPLKTAEPASAEEARLTVCLVHPCAARDSAGFQDRWPLAIESQRGVKIPKHSSSTTISLSHQAGKSKPISHPSAVSGISGLRDSRARHCVPKILSPPLQHS